MAPAFRFCGAAVPAPVCPVFVGAAAAASVVAPTAGCVTCKLDGVLALFSALKRAARPLADMGVTGTCPLGTVLTEPCAVGRVPGVANPVDVEAVCVDV